MAEAEKKRPDPVDFVSVATPNHTHFEIAKTFAEAGFNVICDKPLTFDLAQAEELLKVVEKTGVVFAVTHNYTGYPLVRQAREMVLNGELGEINAVRAFYIQGWLRTRLEASDQKQAEWRTDPKQSGAAGCFGDIGTHAYNLGRYITGLSAEGDLLPAQDVRERPGARRLRRRSDPLRERRARHRDRQPDQPRPRERPLHRDRRHEGGARVAPGRAEQDDRARERRAAQDLHARRRAVPRRSAAATSARLPSGHPEAFFEAFANVYTAAYDDMVKRASGEKFETVNTIYPNVYDGVEGMMFITQCVESSKENGGWVPFRHPKSRK